MSRKSQSLVYRSVPSPSFDREILPDKGMIISISNLLIERPTEEEGKVFHKD